MNGPPVCQRQAIHGDCLCCGEAADWWHDVVETAADEEEAETEDTFWVLVGSGPDPGLSSGSYRTPDTEQEERHE